MSSIKLKTVSGVKWQVVNKVSQKLISVATFAVLARMLEPSAFGLMALAFVFIDGIGLFRAFGVDSGIIQKKNCPEIYLHTAFFLIQINGFIMFAICYLLAPAAAHFFKNPDVGTVIKALGVIFIVNCAGRISQAALIKSMRFKEISAIEMIGAVTNSIFSIFFAWLSPTVWALIWAYVIKQTAMTLLTRFLSPYRLKWHFDWKAASDLVGFGKYLVGLSVIWYVSAQIGVVIIGRMLGTAAVGYFALSRNLINFINTHFTLLISNVMFPAYAELQHDPAYLKRAYLKTVRFVSIFSMPFSLGIMVMAKELCLALYGDKWIPIVPLIQIMSAGQILSPLIASTSSIFNACGKPKYSYYLALIHFLVSLPLTIVLVYKLGLYGPPVAGIITSMLIGPVYYFLIKKIVVVEQRDIWPQIWPSLACSLAMVAVVMLFKTYVIAQMVVPAYHGKHILELLVLTAVGLGSYFLVFHWIDRKSINEVRQLIFKWEAKEPVMTSSLG